MRGVFILIWNVFLKINTPLKKMVKSTTNFSVNHYFNYNNKYNLGGILVFKIKRVCVLSAPTRSKRCSRFMAVSNDCILQRLYRYKIWSLWTAVNWQCLKCAQNTLNQYMFIGNVCIVYKLQPLTTAVILCQWILGIKIPLRLFL